ncbi:hypothetical protein [Herminiimonas arsenitoxidans]|uniref:hypothetical protein n=1 Tax=Herminiimonas arsenitoxidans TaxID=1809410 RepID=UPI0012FFC4C2|nr:hypothetical protein [Herminiimonas arsenitoxidans]
MAGAYFGARAAKGIAEKAKIKDDLLKSLKQINSALVTAHGACNRFLTYKAQLTSQLMKDYKASKKNWREYLESKGQVALQPVVANFVSLPGIAAPIEVLSNQIYGEIDLSPKGSMALITLCGVNSTLNGVIERRNILIEEFKKLGGFNTEKFFHTYFGTHDTKSSQDSKYSDLMHTIENEIDDGIFFSMLVSEELELSGKKALRELKENYGIKDINLIKFDMSAIRGLDLIPNDDLYKDWLKAFPKP